MIRFFFCQGTGFDLNKIQQVIAERNIELRQITFEDDGILTIEYEDCGHFVSSELKGAISMNHNITSYCHSYHPRINMYEINTDNTTSTGFHYGGGWAVFTSHAIAHIDDYQDCFDKIQVKRNGNIIEMSQALVGFTCNTGGVDVKNPDVVLATVNDSGVMDTARLQPFDALKDGCPRKLMYFFQDELHERTIIESEKITNKYTLPLIKFRTDEIIPAGASGGLVFDRFYFMVGMLIGGFEGKPKTYIAYDYEGELGLKKIASLIAPIYSHATRLTEYRTLFLSLKSEQLMQSAEQKMTECLDLINGLTNAISEKYDFRINFAFPGLIGQSSKEFLEVTVLDGSFTVARVKMLKKPKLINAFGTSNEDVSIFPLFNISEKTLWKMLIKLSQKSRDRATKEYATILLKDKNAAIKSGIHHGKTPDKNYQADWDPHVTVKAGNYSYHVKFKEVQNGSYTPYKITRTSRGS